MTARWEMTAHQHDDVGMDAGEFLGKHDVTDASVGAPPRNVEEVDGVQLVRRADRQLGVQHFCVGWTRYDLFHVKLLRISPTVLGRKPRLFRRSRARLRCRSGRCAPPIVRPPSTNRRARWKRRTEDGRTGWSYRWGLAEDSRPGGGRRARRERCGRLRFPRSV